MTTLVTGAAGFIGSAVVRQLLARGRAVRALVEPGTSVRNLAGLEVEQVVGALQDREAIARAIAGCEVVYHLAAIFQLWLPDPRVMYEVNVEGTKTLLFAAQRAGVRRFIHTSSIAAVGLPRDGELADETTPFSDWNESSDYVRSKWLSELDALRFAREGLPVVIVNPAFPFGERDAAPTPTGSFIVEALAGRVPGFPGGGFNAVDVDDVAACHVFAEERGRVGERYLAGGHNVTYQEFYATVTELAGLPPIRRRLPGPLIEAAAWAAERWAAVTQTPPRVTRAAAHYATRRVWFDCTKARTELGMPLTPLRDTISRAIAWFRASGYGG